MEKQTIRSIRKGTAQWNEADRLEVARLLIKCGYAVKISHQQVPNKKNYRNPPMEYIVEYWEE